MAKKQAVIAVLILNLFFPAGFYARQEQEAVIQSRVELVQVPVIVYGPRGEVVTDLQCGNFRIYEDGVEQEIRHCFHDPEPVSVGLLDDVSKSMTNKIEFVRSASLEILDIPDTDEKHLKEVYEGDQFLVVTFESRARILNTFTSDRQALGRLLARLLNPTTGYTALYDALYLGVYEVKTYAANYRRAIILVTDGEDNSSRYNFRQTKQEMLVARPGSGLSHEFDPCRGPLQKLGLRDEVGPFSSCAESHLNKAGN